MPFPNRWSKFGNRKSGGYDSKLEHARAIELEAQQAAGEIADLRKQVEFEVIPKCGKERACKYRADFAYTIVASGEKVVEDTKGFRTPEYRIKRKLMLFRFGIVIRETAPKPKPKKRKDPNGKTT